MLRESFRPKRIRILFIGESSSSGEARHTSPEDLSTGHFDIHEISLATVEE